MLAADDVAVMLVVFAAFLVEAMVGFGSTVLTVTLGAQWVPLDTLLPAFVPISLGISTFILFKSRADLDVQFLLRRLLPWIGVGMALGVLVVFPLRGEPGILAGFGVMVVALAVLNLLALRGGTSAPPLPLALGNGLMVLAGVVHGLFGSGGPLVVFVLSRELNNKRAFRAVLALLWLALNLVLCVNYASAGMFTATSFRLGLLMVPSLALGAWLGNHLHGVVEERTFRIISQVILMVAGGALAGRSLLQ